MARESQRTPEKSDNATVLKRTFTVQITALEYSTSPLIIVTAHMTDTEIDRAIDDAKRVDKELLIRDRNVKLFEMFSFTPQHRGKNNLETSELELASDLSSSTEQKIDPIPEEKKLIKKIDKNANHKD